MKYRKDIRKSWEVMRSIIKTNNDKSSISSIFKQGDILITDPNEIADGFCEYFTTVGSNLS